jgi:hypothetical protein
VREELRPGEEGASSGKAGKGERGKEAPKCDSQFAGAARRLRVRIQDFKPYFTWGLVFRHFLVAHSLATYEVDKLALNNLVFTLPIEQALALHLPKSAVVQRVLTPRGNGSWVDYQVSHRADIDFKRTLHVDSILFLRDGIHVFASVN